MCELVIFAQKGVVSPAIVDRIEWTTERVGVAGKLTFKTIFDENNTFEEGDVIQFKYNNTPIFKGVIFSIKRDKDLISVTAYDQLRYLKNIDVYDYRNKRASEVIKMLANDFNLNLGEIEDTKFIIPKRLEDGVSLFDIILTALDLTLQNIKELYVLYDDFGKLSLKNIKNMETDILIDETNSENFSYKTSIDNSANQIKIVKSTDSKREIYIEKDSSSINRWGVLQHYDTVNDKENPIMKAQSLLKIYNRKQKNFTIKNVIGNTKVRAGSSFFVKLNLGDIDIKNKMIVEKVKHIFKFQEHTMELTLKGRD